MARTLCRLLGSVLLLAGAAGFAEPHLLGLLGFVAPGVVSTILGHALGLDAKSLLPDNLLHLALGGAFLFAGLAQPTHRTVSVTRPNL